MKIAFIVRNNLFSTAGGDTKQVEMTAKKLIEIGVDVDIILTQYSQIEYEKYDILHFFNIIRPQDILPHINRHKLIVVSTIYVDYFEYELNVRKGFLNVLTRLFGKNAIEYLKSIARDIKAKQISSFKYYLFGQKKSIKYIAERVSCFLPNSENEWRRFKKDYDINSNFYQVIPNSIDQKIFGSEIIDFTKKDKKLVLCVGQIEGRKNQLNLIKALNDTEYELYLIGKPASNQMNYYNLCKSIAKSNVHFFSFMPWEELKSYYLKASIHILPSYFETTGLSSLEAAVMGCKIIVTNKGDTYDYFRDDAIYCDPYSSKSIYESIIKASEMDFNSSLMNRIKNENTWEITAEKTKKSYLDLLNKSR